PIHLLAIAFRLSGRTFETITPGTRRPNSIPPFKVHIADNRDEALESHEQAKRRTEVRIYSDGSGYQGMAGACAVLYRGTDAPQTLKYRLGKLSKHTVYEAESVGITLGLRLLGRMSH